MLNWLINLIKYRLNLVRHYFRDFKFGAARSSAWPKLEHAFRAQFPTCAACGTNVKIQIHHIQPFHIHPELELDPKNLITLCMSQKQCHLRLGHLQNYSWFNETIRSDAAEVFNNPSKFEEVIARAKENRTLN